ncbi:molybdate ABC transporter substrate-binding protein [Ramlibacter sp. MMS24-I3-19]|uniref:molybdate ABC transporter substrate-binding protein n=1 Tax=Ramlibacter sp. MMS24-I3-19 TaxID=3416606 RepID=UPI003D05D3B6
MQTVQVISGGAAHGLVRALSAQLAQRNVAIEGSFGAVGAMRDKLLAGTPCDLLILTDTLIAELTKQGHVVPGSARPVGRVPTGIGVRAGESRPDITNGRSLAAFLSNARALYVPDTVKSTAGQHVAKVLRDLGIGEQMAGRLREFPNGATAMREMAASGESGVVGCTQRTEILDTPGVQWVGALPQGYDLAAIYTAAVCARASDRDAAARCVDLLASQAAAQARRDAGFDPL